MCIHEGVVEQVEENDDDIPNEMDDDEDVSPMDNDDDDDDDGAAYTVENAYLEEKEEACLALREIAANSRYQYYCSWCLFNRYFLSNKTVCDRVSYYNLLVELSQGPMIGK